MAGMAFYPHPLNPVTLGNGIQRLPEICVLDRLVIAGTPATAFPAVNPLADTQLNILGVGMHTNLAFPIERVQCLDDCPQFHPVVGGSRLPAVQFFFPVTVAQQHPPPSGSRIAFAGTVGINVNNHALFLGGLMPFFCSARLDGHPVSRSHQSFGG